MRIAPTRGGGTGGTDDEEEEEEEEEEENGGIASRLRDTASSATDAASDAADSATDAAESTVDRARSATSTSDSDDDDDSDDTEDTDESDATQEDSTSDDLRDRATDRASDALDRLTDTADEIDAGRVDAGSVDATERITTFESDEIESDLRSDVADDLDGVDEDDVRIVREDGQFEARVRARGEQRTVAEVGQDEFREAAAGQIDGVESDDLRAEFGDGGIDIVAGDDAQREITRQSIASADPRLDEDEVELDRDGAEFDVLLRGDSAQRVEEGVAGGDLRSTTAGLGGFVAGRVGGASDAVGEIDPPVDAVDSTADSVESALGQDVVEDDFDGPRNPTARTRVGPAESRARAQLAQQTDFDEDEVTVRETDDGLVASVDDDARVDRVEQQILDDRDELERGDIDVSVEDGEVVAETPPEFDSDLPVIGDRVEEFRAGQFRRGQAIEDIRSDVFGVDEAEEFEGEGVGSPVSREQLAGAGAVATATPEPFTTAGGVAVLGAVGTATAIEETRRAGTEEGERLTIQDGAEIDVVEERRGGEIPVEDTPAERISEFDIGDPADRVSEIDPRGELIEDRPEIDVADEVQEPGEIQTGTIVDRPTPGDTITPDEPTIEQPEPEPETGDRREREIETGESAVVDGTGRDAVDRIEDTQPSIGEGFIGETGVGIGPGTGTGAGSPPMSQDAQLGDTGLDSLLDVRMSVGTGTGSASLTGSAAGVGTGTTTTTASETIASEVAQPSAFGQGFGSPTSGVRGQRRLRTPDGSTDDGLLSLDGGDGDSDGTDRPLEVGWAAETFEGFALGAFRDPELPEGVDDPGPTGEIPTATFADPDDEEAEALGDVGRVFGFELDNRDDRGGGLL